eukprot:scaffold223945_cov17-Tisochrysis_lutea.AAC.1
MEICNSTGLQAEELWRERTVGAVHFFRRVGRLQAKAGEQSTPQNHDASLVCFRGVLLAGEHLQYSVSRGPCSVAAMGSRGKQGNNRTGGIQCAAVHRWKLRFFLAHLCSALHMQVPLILSQMSATAFFTAMVLNMTSFLFEDSVAKRQLALLSCTIKAAACYSDLLLATGQLPIIFDAHGAL